MKTLWPPYALSGRNSLSSSDLCSTSNQTSKAMMVTTALHLSGGLQRSNVMYAPPEGFNCPLGTDWVGNADLVM